MIRRKLLMAIAIIAAAVTTACSDTTAPDQPASNGSASEFSRKSGALHLTKECSEYAGQPGDHCTVIASNVKPIPVDSRVFYLAAANLEQGTYDGNVELRVKPGSIAFGHCIVTDLFATVAHTVIGNCSFSGGTGRFKGFHAQIVVSVGLDPIWADWDGTYSFSNKGD
jgi:hypothetical protein